METIHGFTLRQLAEANSKHNELNTQHGERDFKPYWHTWLSEQGFDENQWAHAWNSWQERLDADKSGALWAEFSMIQNELSAKAHFGDVEDMTQDKKGGMTMDQFAKLSAKFAQPGADMNSILSEEGITEEQWAAGRDAWNAAMSEDTTHRISMQYGQLYAKYNPAHVAGMMAQQGQLAANREEDSQMEEEEEEEYTFEKAMEDVASKVPAERWQAAGYLVNMIQTELEEDEAKQSVARKATIPQLLECLERHDKETVSNAEAAARALVELKEFTDDAKHAIEMCAGRGAEHLKNLEAAFEPIKDKRVPERVYLQSEIQDYTSLVEDLNDILEDWDDNAASAREAAEEEEQEVDDEPTFQAHDEEESTKKTGFRTGIPIIDNIIGMFA